MRFSYLKRIVLSKMENNEGTLLCILTSNSTSETNYDTIKACSVSNNLHLTFKKKSIMVFLSYTKITIM